MRSALALSILCAVGAGCREQVSTDPPIHLNPNMDQQERFEAQRVNRFFEDGRAARLPVPGTGARDEPLEVRAPASLPVRLDRQLLERGRERFNIYCAPCHDRAGSGEGIVVKRGMVPPPRLTEPRVRAMPLGQIFTTISRGVRNMPSYAAQIPAADRWAIASYVRALQISRGAGLEDVPPDVLHSKGWDQ